MIPRKENRRPLRISRKANRRPLRVPRKKACRHVRTGEFRQRFGTRAPHPGRILNDDFLLRLEITEYGLARGTGMVESRVNAILLGKRAVSVDSALRLGAFFETGPMFWLILQARYDIARQRLAERLGMRPVRRVSSMREFA